MSTLFIAFVASSDINVFGSLVLHVVERQYFCLPIPYHNLCNTFVFLCNLKYCQTTSSIHTRFVVVFYLVDTAVVKVEEVFQLQKKEGDKNT